MSNKSYELHRKLLDSPGMEFFNRMSIHSSTYNIFYVNVKELEKALKLIETPEVRLTFMSQENRDADRQLHSEVNRLFHNFLASAQTLVDHTRIFMKKHYIDESVGREYYNKIDLQA